MNFKTQAIAYLRKIPKNNVSQFGSMTNLSNINKNRQHGYLELFIQMTLGYTDQEEKYLRKMQDIIIFLFFH